MSRLLTAVPAPHTPYPVSLARRIITIHNHPSNLRPSPHIQHLPFELPDVDSADIAQFFQRTFEFIEEARRARHAVLVHCGAGVSRSATLVVMYLMRHKLWSAQQVLTGGGRLCDAMVPQGQTMQLFLCILFQKLLQKCTRRRHV